MASGKQGVRAEAAARDDAKRIIDLWNERLASGLPVLFSPTIGAALISKHHWLRVHCAGCDVVAEIKLQMKPRDPDVTIAEVHPSLSCGRCLGRGPLPRVLGLFPHPSG